MNDIEIIKDIIYSDNGAKMEYIDIDNILDNECENFIQAIENLIQRNKDLEQILELTSKSLDNISYDQIPIAIEELKFKLQDLEQIEQEHKEENGRLRDKIKELEEKQIHRYNKECLNCGVNFIAKRIDTDYCKKCSHIVANRKYKQKNKEKVNAYAKIYMRKRRANKVEEDTKE